MEMVENMLVKRSRAGAGEGMTKVLDLGSSKHALLQVDGKVMEKAEVEYTAEVQLMMRLELENTKYPRD